ncbi:MAG: hypothetical protein M3N56_10515 [Actinomycetota bacterium]|nr:hypothetical protein [Actinomycetota bacterium]
METITTTDDADTRRCAGCDEPTHVDGLAACAECDDRWCDACWTPRHDGERDPCPACEGHEEYVAEANWRY